jgi:UDP-2,3-diacylglucosamine pyrophosphatase LpxH
MSEKILVISDLHVGAGPLDDCDGELEGHLVDFLRRHASAGAPVELVINGDFLDFVQAEPWEGPGLESVSVEGHPLCFTQRQSLEKFDAIAAAHAPIFKALGEFLSAGESNRLVVMPGNHDADLFWPRVRARFRKAVCGRDRGSRGRLRFHLEQGYRPPSAPHVWIEHGHQHDPNNRFFVETDEIDPHVGCKVTKPVWSAARPPIFADVSGEPRLYECIGTRFLIRFMNRLDARYQFVDNVKPFHRFLRIFGVSAFKPGFGPLRAAASVWQMLRYTVREGITSPGSLLSLERPAEGFGPSALLRELVGEMSDEEMAEFVRLLEERGYDGLRGTPDMHVKDPEGAESLLSFISEHMELVDELEAADYGLLSADGTPGTLSMGAGFFVDETAELVEAAHTTLDREGVSHVVMGHTHEPVVSPAYVNTGCWTRYFRFGDDGEMRSWKVLNEDSYELFPYRLGFAEIVPGADPPVRADFFREKDYDTTG